MRWQDAPQSALERIAASMRFTAEQLEDAPEGIETFTWWWVGESRASYPLIAPTAFEPVGAHALDGYTPPATVKRNETKILASKRFVHDLGLEGFVGWNRRDRTAAIFFAGGGTLPNRLKSSADQLDALVTEGAELLQQERRVRIAERWQRLLDDLGLNEGEEWKRED